MNAPHPIIVDRRNSCRIMMYLLKEIGRNGAETVNNQIISGLNEGYLTWGALSDPGVDPIPNTHTLQK